MTPPAGLTPHGGLPALVLAEPRLRREKGGRGGSVMGTATGILVGIFLILLALTQFGIAIPAILLGIVGIMAGVLVIATGIPWPVKQ